MAVTEVPAAIAEKVIADIVMVDILEGMTRAKALDFLHAGPLRGYDTPIRGTGDFSDIACAVVGRVPDAGLHRDEGRRARLVLNGPIVKDLSFKLSLDLAKSPALLEERAREAEAAGLAVRGVSKSDGASASAYIGGLVLVTSHSFQGATIASRHAVSMTPLDHERPRRYQGCHLGIVVGVAQVEFEDLVLASPHVAVVAPRGRVLPHPFIEIGRAN